MSYLDYAEHSWNDMPLEKKLLAKVNEHNLAMHNRLSDAKYWRSQGNRVLLEGSIRNARMESTQARLYLRELRRVRGVQG